MSIEQRIEELTELLIRGTREGSLRWEPTADEDAFRLSSPIANVRLSKSAAYDLDTEPVVFRALTIHNDRGRVIEQYSPRQGPAGRFDELFLLARRSACKTDEIRRTDRSDSGSGQSVGCNRLNGPAGRFAANSVGCQGACQLTSLDHESVRRSISFRAMNSSASVRVKTPAVVPTARTQLAPPRRQA